MSETPGPIEADAIRSLDDRTVERIAAGEVVERPASAVKELVENSLDADASRIAVEVENGGVDRILVRDDGAGMTDGALGKAIKRHTTSKLRGAEELDAGLSTLGFRGEALYTIAAVSRLTIRTRPREEPSGTELRAVGGDVEEIGPTGCPVGTSVEARDLFFNTPARREFLNETATEFDHVNRVVANYALANPSVAFSLTHDGREVFAAPGRGDLKGTVLAVWGRDVAQAMRSVDRSFEDGPIHRVRGLVSDPETTRSRPRYVSTFVNGRYVTSSALREAVLDGYGRQLGPERYPFVVLACRVDSGAIDVNIHPRKLEVRFQAESAVRDNVTEAVRETLLEEGLVRTKAPRGRSAPEDATLPTDRDEKPAGSRPGTDRSPGEDAPSRSNSPRSTARRFRGNTEQRTLEADTPAVETRSLPDLDVLGQLDETYIVAASSAGLILIDQHAADERVHYERLEEHVDAASTSQELVRPVEVSLTPDEVVLAEDIQGSLASIGFQYSVTADHTVTVSAVPSIVDAGADPERLRDALGALLEGAAESSVDSLVDDVLADLACYPAITGHTPLTEGSVVSLIEALDDCTNPYACPHGRPVLIRIDQDELDDRFERDYPGHAH